MTPKVGLVVSAAILFLYCFFVLGWKLLLRLTTKAPVEVGPPVRRCGTCARVFKHGDYISIVLGKRTLWRFLQLKFKRPRSRACRACVKDRTVVTFGLFGAGEISSVSRDRVERRLKKMKRRAKALRAEGPRA